jgi:flagellar L-ring protein precursor FlgH
MSVGLPFDQAGLSAKLGAESESSFTGSGNAAQSNSFTGLLSVSVIRIFANGNMEIMGQKMITLNNGNEYVRLRGVIRPEDISAANVIVSSQVADAKITYTGAGQVADSGQMGWLGRGLRAVSPF